jgi:MFS family permease
MIMLWTLSLSAFVAFALVQLTTPIALTVLLVVEGVAYGLFVVSAQATVSTQAKASRGAALGAFMAAAAVGDSFVPLLLGPLADALGIQSVFYVVGGIIVVGIGVIIYILYPRRRIGLPDSRL